MDGLLYPASLVVIALLALTFFKSNNNILMVIVIVIGIYIVYSHETGYTATDFKNEMVESVDESVGKYNKSHENKGFDETSAKEAME